MTKEEILNEIRRTAAENGGKPLGRERFHSITGISEYELGRYWARFGDAQREAGFEPNRLNAAYDESFLIEKFVDLTRRLGHVPTRGELRLERATAGPSFPTPNVFARFGTKNDLIGKILNYCRESAEYADLVPILQSAYRPGQAPDTHESLPPD